MVTRGEETRDAILEKALEVASSVGLEGLTIGTLSEQLELSKSGLFAHFGSKEALQLRTLEHAQRRFTEVVVKPALAAPRGEPRLRELFERVLRWPTAVPQPGGCIFISAAAEFDDRPGPVRDHLRRIRQEWQDFIADAVRRAIQAGHFRRDVDPDQFAFETVGIGLSWHHAKRLLEDPHADARAHRAFEALLSAARAPRRG
jgi:AcrR family transcriptional regulator